MGWRRKVSEGHDPSLHLGILAFADDFHSKDIGQASMRIRRQLV